MLFILLGVPEIRKYKKGVNRLCFVNKIEERILNTATIKQRQSWECIKTKYVDYSYSVISFIRLYRNIRKFINKYNIPEDYLTYSNFIKRIEECGMSVE